MKTFFALAFIGAASAITEVEQAFLGYISEFGKEYATVEEYGFRLSQFVRAHSEILEHNATESSFKLGHNQMSDWTQQEYENILTLQEMPEADKNFEYIPESEMLMASTGIDWRSHNGYAYVNAIKDQGQCGSCWAFSTNCAVESSWAMYKGGLYSLAEQLLVDCDTGCYGCNGGWQYKGIQYYETHYGIAESTYKYTARDGTCKYNSYAHTTVKTAGYTNVTPNSSTQMKAALESYVLSVSIEADKSVFQRYSSGIFNSTACGTRTDHATNVVGWGSSNGVEYWIMRNSWGKYWGESGYMRMEITSGKGVCAVQSAPLYARV